MALCNGQQDDTAANQAAGGYGVGLFPTGTASSRTTATISVPHAVTLACAGSPAQNA